jgi:hypothetical protein
VRHVLFRSYDEVFRSAPCDLFFLDRTMRFLDRRVLSQKRGNYRVPL